MPGRTPAPDRTASAHYTDRWPTLSTLSLACVSGQKIVKCPKWISSKPPKPRFCQFWRYPTWVFSENFTLGSTPSDTYQIIGNKRMPNTINLTTHFAQQVITAASAGCNTIVSGTLRTARQLCGPDFWDALAKPEHIHAGKIVSAAVNARMLPLVRDESSRSNHQRYQLG